MPERPINVDAQWFDLKADPGALDTAARAWTTFGDVGDEAGNDLNTAAADVYDDPWEGDTRDKYEEHQKKVRDTCVDMPDAAKPIADALTAVASALRAAQIELDAIKTTVTSSMPCTVGSTQITFLPNTPEQSQQVHSAVSQARTTRTNLDATLTAERDKLTTANGEWKAMSSQWRSIANGGVEDAFPLPPEAANPSPITLPDGTVVVGTGSGDDDVSVTTKPDGTIVVTVNGTTTEYPPGTDIVVHTGGGDDKVTVEPNSSVSTTIVTGDGDDYVDTGSSTVPLGSNGNHTVLTGDGADRVKLGDGDNRVSTGGGDDHVSLGNGDNHISTGDGEDSVDRGTSALNPFRTVGGDNTISTGRGDDSVTTGSGDDRIYGGDGADTIRANGGKDDIVGGRGDDTLYGGDGGDNIHAGDGRDYVDGGDGGDTVSGGDGNDVLYGMNGDDRIHGGDGDDYIEGAKGDDRIDGGVGDDILSGGRGDDQILGGSGNDKLYGGDGTDYVHGGDGSDEAFIQDDDTVSAQTEREENVTIVDHSFINVEGSQEFKDRVEADLDMLASSPTGQQGIDHLRDNRDPNAWGGNHELTIRETSDGNSASAGDQSIWGNKDSSVNYNPSGLSGWDDRPPVVGLYHELAHVNTYWDGSYDGDKVGTGPDSDIKKAERQATGLPTDGSAYDPNNPEANLDLDYDLTENGLRDEFGMPPRTTYT